MRIAIIGAGPAGLLLAHYLCHRGVPYDVDVYERRADIRKLSPSDARTFPLALMSRGVNAIKNVPGLLDAVENAAVKINGVCVHKGKKTITTSRPSSYNSIDRNVLVKVLLEELEKDTGKTPGSKVSVKFERKISKVDFGKKSLQTTNADGKDTITEQYDCLVASDGAGSLIRRLLAEEGKLSYTEKLAYGSYKSIYLETNSKDIQSLQLGKIHRWGSGDYTVGGILLQPDLLSGVFGFPDGEDPLKSFTEASQVYDLLMRNKLDEVVELLPEEEAQALIERPVSTLMSVTTDTLHIADSVLLIGDAAHAMSASMGQGCNSALEDVRIFCDCLDAHGDNWSEALPEFTRRRLEDTHAVVEMSHYSNPRTPLMRMELSIRIMMRRLLPSWLSRFLGKLPMDTVLFGDRRYSEALSDCRWWIERVKATIAD